MTDDQKPAREWWIFGRHLDQATNDPTEQERHLGVNVIEKSAYDAVKEECDAIQIQKDLMTEVNIGLMKERDQTLASLKEAVEALTKITNCMGAYDKGGPEFVIASVVTVADIARLKIKAAHPELFQEVKGD